MSPFINQMLLLSLNFLDLGTVVVNLVGYRVYIHKGREAVYMVITRSTFLHCKIWSIFSFCLRKEKGEIGNKDHVGMIEPSTWLESK